MAVEDIERGERRAMTVEVGRRNLTRFAVIQAARQICLWQQLTAVTILLIRLTDDAFIVSLATAMQFTPMLLLGGWIGAMSDRHDRRRMLLQLSLANQAVAIALLVAVVADVASWPVLLGLSTVVGTIFCAEHPVRRAFLNELVPRELLATGVGINAAVLHGARLVGPVVAGLLIAGPGAAWCLGVGATMLALQTLLLFQLKTLPSDASSRTARQPGQIVAGLQYARSHQRLGFALLLIGGMAIVTLNLPAMLALLVTREFGGADSTYTLVVAFFGAGAIAGASLVPRVARDLRRIAMRGVQVGALLIGVALAPNIYVAAMLLFGIGVLGVQMASGAEAFIQLMCDERFIGRVVGLVSIVSMGSAPVSAPLLGIVAEHSGTRVSVGLLAMAVAVPGTFVSLRHDTGARAPVGPVQTIEIPPPESGDLL